MAWFKHQRVNRPLLMYTHPMAISLETQEIIFAFAADNKDNFESWGKYELDELQNAYAELPEEEITSSTGKRIKDRIKELESGHDQVKEAIEQVSSDNPLDDRHDEDESPDQEAVSELSPKSESNPDESKQNTPIIIGGIIVGVIVLLLVIYLI